MPKMIISRTPVRISLFGGGTDYPDYYKDHGGAVFGTTINQYTYVSINTLTHFFDHNIRVGYSKTELVRTHDEIQHPSVRECLKFLKVPGNLDIHVFSDLPAKTGLGSSSSFTVGFLNGLYALQGQLVSKGRLAEEAVFIEQQRIQENVGSQDQYHAAHGGLNVIEFSDSEIRIRPVITSPEKKRLLEDSLLVFYTGLTRHASEIVKEQIEKTRSHVNDSSLHEMKQLVYIAERLFSEAKTDEFVQELGTLLDQSWQLKKQLSSKISAEPIDAAYDAAKKAGAYGGKLCGAGSGGFLALLAPNEAKDKIRSALSPMLEVSFRFESEGSTIIYMRD